MKILIKLADDSVAIMTIIGDADVYECIQKWIAANPGKYVSHREITEADIPADRSKRHLWRDNQPGPQIDIDPDPPPTLEEKKLNRAAAVAAITVQVSTGKIFDGDEASQTRMTRAIMGMQAISRPTITWTLADNTVTDVTLAELTEALCLAGERQAELWPIT